MYRAKNTQHASISQIYQHLGDIVNLELAHTMLRQHGYCLELRDIKKRSRTFCLVIANNGHDERFLCNISRFAQIGTERFNQLIETRMK